MLREDHAAASHDAAEKRPSSCPIDHAAQPQRRTAPPTEPSGPPLAQGADGVWHVHGYREARAILRSDNTKQAGFQAELLDKMPGYMNKPVLYMEGAAHHEQRRQTARFFTPRTTERAYRDLMEETADQLIARLQRDGRVDLSEISMAMAVRVASQVVGLTDSYLPGIERRISRFVEREAVGAGRSPRHLLNFVKTQMELGAFFLLDVLPAIRARRAEPQEDVISHLIDSDYGNTEILTECITYGTAGMVTTREFICVAAWHLLEHPALHARYLEAEQEERYAILHEILRLEPVVGRLYRRATADLEIESGGATVTIPAGARIVLHLYAVNADETVVGDAPLQLCPERLMAELRPRVMPYVMGFGDGHHRCPGAFIAIQESDIFLQRLLALPGLHIGRRPDVRWNDVVKGYEIRNFVLALPPAA